MKSVLALPLLAGLAVPALAQETKYRSVSRYRVKPDRAGDFALNIKEYISVMKKSNPERSFSTWTSLTGPQEYVLVSYHAKYAELDQNMMQDPKLKDVAAQLAAIASRINACVEGGERYVDEIQTELSLPRPAEMPKTVRMIRSRVKPDQVNNYINLIRTEALPTMKKAGAQIYTVTRMRYGRPSSEFASVTALENWAALDSPSPFVQAMGEAGYQKYLAKLAAMLDESEINLYRHMPELSYTPAK
jgi:quinol monooxygenase YgiN